MMPYCNNLKKGDEVEVIMKGRRGPTYRRPGIVHMQPRDTSTMVSVMLKFTKTARYIPVESLRLVVDGKAEDVAPIDGVIPRIAPDTLPPAKSVPLVHRTTLQQSEMSTAAIGDGAAHLYECSNTAAVKIPRLTIMTPFRLGRIDEKDHPAASMCFHADQVRQLYDFLHAYFK